MATLGYWVTLLRSRAAPRSRPGIATLHPIKAFHLFRLAVAGDAVQLCRFGAYEQDEGFHRQQPDATHVGIQPGGQPPRVDIGPQQDDIAAGQPDDGEVHRLVHGGGAGPLAQGNRLAVAGVIGKLCLGFGRDQHSHS